MALELTVDSIDKVDEKYRDLYEEKEGKFSLKVSGIEDTSALKRAKDHEKEARKQAEERAAKLQEQLEKLADDGHRKKGDTEALDKSWQEKFGKTVAEKDAEIAKREQWLRNMTVNATAQGLAAELAVEGSSKALLPHIQARLAMEMRDGMPVAVVLGPDGKPSALTVAELKQEFINDAAFAPLIVGSKASGAGGAKGSKGGSATTTDPLKMATAEKSAFIAEHGVAKWSELLAGAGKKSA